MIVVADTSPLNYLVLIGEIELLAALYQKVLIPEEVLRELQRTGTPPCSTCMGGKSACMVPGAFADLHSRPPVERVGRRRARCHSAGVRLRDRYSAHRRSRRTAGGRTPPSEGDRNCCHFGKVGAARANRLSYRIAAAGTDQLPAFAQHSQRISARESLRQDCYRI
jgi:hypothetical protein